MTGEEMQRTMEFIVNQQAQLTATVGQLAVHVESLSRKVDRTADSTAALLAIAEIHDREIKETDERLNALITTVERHISSGGHNSKG
jgi:hypothetical protein